MSSNNSCDVLIIGAGPTGLMLGILCALRGIHAVILEKRADAVTHSRSIGIHSPSLPIFEEAGIIEALIAAGNRIDRGSAYLENEYIGDMDFSKQSAPYPFIITCSQTTTEKMLEKRFSALAPGSLMRGYSAETLSVNDSGCHVFTHDNRTFSAPWLLACDGKNSRIREWCGIESRNHTYPDTYMMGDFHDGNGTRNTADVHLCRAGLVESFPHGNNMRRWVIHSGGRQGSPAPELIARTVHERTGRQPAPRTCTMTSLFQPSRNIASTFIQGRVLLAGDAAHEISPIGGQGMNLGWLDASALADALMTPDYNTLYRCAERRRILAIKAARQAERNMSLGRPFRSLTTRKLILMAMLSRPLTPYFISRFSMQYLNDFPKR